MKSNRVKITILIVLMILVGTGLLLLISYRRASGSMTAQLEKNYSIVADKYAQELTAWVNTNATIIDTMAAEITASEIYQDDYDTFHTYLANNYALLNTHGYIYDIYFTYPDNRMACASDFVADGSVDYVNERDWFIKAAGTGELFYSTPYRDSDSGKPVITISKAVYQDNLLQGVLAADIFVDVLVNIISEADVAPDSYAFLVDQNLGMIAHPNEAYTFDDIPYGVMDIPGAPYADVISKIRAGSNQTVYLKDFDGVMRGVVVSKMSNTGWSVGIATSRTEIMRGMSSLTRGYLIAAVVAVLVAGTIAILLARVLEQLDGQETRKKKEHKVEKTVKAAPMMGRIGLLVPILFIFLLMIGMVLYTSNVISSVAATNIREVGEDRISASAAQLENYLQMIRSSLWVTADTVDLMEQRGDSPQEILRYIREETQNQQQDFDDNYIGIYGYVMGEYMDGLDWVPPANYDPTRRDWYVAAIRAAGEATIVSPYLDANTGDVIISISRMLTNGSDVLSLDVRMNQIQEIASNLQIKGKGYGFIINGDGMIIAHQDEEKKGGNLKDTEAQLALMDRILEVENGSFEMIMDNQKQHVFVQKIMDQWYMVIVISDSELLSEVRQQVIVNVLICFVIFTLITLFYLLGHRREQKYSKRIEEMRIEEQKQAYEAKMLKLEKEAADQANQAKSDFLADMSHEIRTPINAVLGMNEMIIRESLEEKTDPDTLKSVFENIRSYAGKIESAGSNLLAIINDILDFSKIESGKLDLIPGEYSLSSLLNDTSNMIFYKAQEKGLDFIVDVEETIPDLLYGDEVRVRQILTNLLNNAVKYTKQGSVHLDVRGEMRKTEETEQILDLIISVKDTGIGIRSEDIDKLFRKFQRVDLDTNKSIEGTGLGLAITQNLLEMMHGDIRVESEYGIGSDFIVRLPQRVVSDKPIGNFETKFGEDVLLAKERKESFDAPDAELLIVDDTKLNLDVAVGLLKNTQIRITTALSGEEAIRLAGEVRYDLILMDQRMPKMDGTEALSRIREQKDGKNKDTPVICLTADAVVGAKERYLRDGFTDYLTKPVEGMALERMIMKYLPDEKIIIRENTQAAEELTASDGANTKQYAALRAVWIDPATGMNFCGTNEALYESVLKDFAGESTTKSAQIQKCMEEENWEEYSVHVHAIKSTSKMIGALKLSKMAAALEKAADEGNAAQILDDHAKMEALYRQTVTAIRQELPEEEQGDFEPDEFEVLEFSPEEDDA